MFPAHGTDHASARRALAELAAAVEIARDPRRHRDSPPLDVLAERVREALYTLRRAWLDFYGVTCPCCRGEGETPADELPASMGSPAEVTMSACPVCRGVGEVLIDEAAKWIDAHFERFGEDDFTSAGLLDWLFETGHAWVALRDS